MGVNTPILTKNGKDEMKLEKGEKVKIKPGDVFTLFADQYPMTLKLAKDDDDDDDRSNEKSGKRKRDDDEDEDTEEEKDTVKKAKTSKHAGMCACVPC